VEHRLREAAIQGIRTIQCGYELPGRDFERMKSPAADSAIELRGTKVALVTTKYRRTLAPYLEQGIEAKRSWRIR